VVHLERVDRGAVLAGLRLVGPRSAERWSSPFAAANGSRDRGAENDEAVLDPAGDARATARDAAAWLAERLKAERAGRRIDRLVIDADGAVCSWVSATDAEPRIVRALVTQHAGGGEADLRDDAAGDEHGPGRFPNLPDGELTVQPLAEQDERPISASGDALASLRRRFTSLGSDADAEDGGPRRLPVLAVPEAPARLLLDELDREGVEVGSVGSVFNAAAAVWDASARAAGASGDDPLVATAGGCTAVILVDPAGRMTWCWSVRGGVVAAGSARLAGGVARPASSSTALDRSRSHAGVDLEQPPSVRITPGVMARVSTEWISWAAQLGVVPTRVAIVAPCSALEVGPAGSNGAGGLDATGVAAALRRAVPDATVDLVDDDDPVGLTLRRLAELHDDASPAVARTPGDMRRSLTALSRRPGRAHRAMYRWSALAFVAAGAALSTLTWHLLQRAEAFERTAATLSNQRRALLEDVDPSLIVSPFPARTIEDRIRSAGSGGVALDAPPPILRELETLSFVLGVESYTLSSLSLNPFAASFTVNVPGIAEAEQLSESLRSIGQSSINWPDPSITQAGATVRVSATGRWFEDAGADR